MKCGCVENIITYKHLSCRLNVQDKFKVEMLISVSRSVLPSNGKQHSEVKEAPQTTDGAAAGREDRRHNHLRAQRHMKSILQLHTIKMMKRHHLTCLFKCV